MSEPHNRPLSLFGTLWLALRFSLASILIAVTAAVWMFIALFLLPWRPVRIKLVNLYGKLIGRGGLFLAGVKPVVRNRERLNASFPAIYVANHTTTLDALPSIWLCPIGGCGVMKKQVKKIPFFGQLYLLSGHLSLDRESSGKAIAALNHTGELVKRHRLGIWIMPEGTRSPDGRLRPLKPGFVHLAIATGLPVVPVIFHNAHHMWPNRTMRIRSGTLRIDVLPAIDTKDWKTETAKQHAAAVHDVMADALGDEQKPLPATKDS